MLALFGSLQKSKAGVMTGLLYSVIVRSLVQKGYIDQPMDDTLFVCAVCLCRSVEETVMGWRFHLISLTG